MAFDSESLGATDDVVRLKLAGEELLIAESYEVNVAVMSQPAGWAIRTGYGGVAADLLSKYRAGTNFELSIGTVVQQTGVLEDIDAEQDPSGGTTITLAGRDWMFALVKAFVRAVKSFHDPTYLDLVKWALGEVGLAGRLIVKTNTANRRARAGVPITELSLPHRTVEEILQETKIGGGSTFIGVVHQQLQAQLGTTVHAFVKTFLDRAGLVLFAAADGSFVLTTPNIHQTPTYRIVRKRLGGDTRATVNVEHARFRNHTSGRHTEALIYGKGGGFKTGRLKSKGAFEDPEMKALGFNAPLVLHDKAVQNPGQAIFLAKRRISDERRNGYSVEYTVTGHTVPAMGSGLRAVWTPDTVVKVEDELLGIDTNFYLEACKYLRSGDGTTTQLTLHRNEDMIFGELTE